MLSTVSDVHVGGRQEKAGTSLIQRDLITFQNPYLIYISTHSCERQRLKYSFQMNGEDTNAPTMKIGLKT